MKTRLSNSKSVFFIKEVRKILCCSGIKPFNALSTKRLYFIKKGYRTFLVSLRKWDQSKQLPWLKGGFTWLGKPFWSKGFQNWLEMGISRHFDIFLPCTKRVKQNAKLGMFSPSGTRACYPRTLYVQELSLRNICPLFMGGITIPSSV